MPRIHCSTWIVLAIVAAALVVFNIPGNRRATYDAYFSMFQPMFAGGPGEYFEHGWPCVYLQRETSTSSCGFPEPTSAWHFGQPVRWFYWPALVANLLAGGVICALAAMCWERRCRRRKWWQISITDGLIATTFIAAVCGFVVFQLDAARREAATLRIIQHSQYTGFGSTASSAQSEVAWPSAFTELAFATPPAALTRVSEVHVLNKEHLQYLPEFYQLRLVSISEEVTTADLQPLSACRGLRVLSINSHMRVRGADWLDGYYDRLPQGEPLEIPAFRQLEQFSISTPNYHGAGLEHFTKLKYLDLAKCSIADEDLPQIGAMANLVYLDLSDTQVTDAGLAHLARLQQLECLRLPPQTTDAGVRHLTGLSRLRELDLRESQVTDEGLSTLQRLTSLIQIDLNQTGVSAEGVQRLSAALPGSTIYQTLVGESCGTLGGDPTDEKVLYGRELQELFRQLE